MNAMAAEGAAAAGAIRVAADAMHIRKANTMQHLCLFAAKSLGQADELSMI